MENWFGRVPALWWASAVIAVAGSPAFAQEYSRKIAPAGKPATLSAALVLEDDTPPLLPVKQFEPPANTPAPPPISSTDKPRASTGTAEPAPPPAMNPIPLDGGAPLPMMMGDQIVGAPSTVGPLGVGDRFPIYYREPAVGTKAEKAARISQNRANEPGWYKEWRCNHYGYYPTQWRPWPNGWHEARNLPPSPYVHPYDLKQPDPETSQGKAPSRPKNLPGSKETGPDATSTDRDRDRERDREGAERDRSRGGSTPTPPPLNQKVPGAGQKTN